MELIGMEVTHKKYGTGKIMGVSENRMKIQFPQEVKSFQCPEAFESFIFIEDERLREFMDDKIEVLNQTKNDKKEHQMKREKASAYAAKMGKKTNSQAAFGMMDNTYENVVRDGSVFTGYNLSGKSKGEPRIPQNMNINSSCIITRNPGKNKEAEREITGIFMVSEDFIGENCKTGIIPIHPIYRIIWGDDCEKVLFWNYFPEEKRAKSWGKSEIKYLPVTIVKEILEDMINGATDEKKEEIMEFYQYFCRMNRM